MAERDRPPWLRVVALLTTYVGLLGLVIFQIDLARHPPDPNLSRWDVLLQRYRHRRDLQLPFGVGGG